MARFLVELHRTEDGGVEGVLTREETGQPQAFSGWLELLRLLETTEGGQQAHPAFSPQQRDEMARPLVTDSPDAGRFDDPDRG